LSSGNAGTPEGQVYDSVTEPEADRLKLVVPEWGTGLEDEILGLPIAEYIVRLLGLSDMVIELLGDGGDIILETNKRVDEDETIYVVSTNVENITRGEGLGKWEVDSVRGTNAGEGTPRDIHDECVGNKMLDGGIGEDETTNNNNVLEAGNDIRVLWVDNKNVSDEEDGGTNRFKVAVGQYICVELEDASKTDSTRLEPAEEAADELTVSTETDSINELEDVWITDALKTEDILDEAGKVGGIRREDSPEASMELEVGMLRDLIEIANELDIATWLGNSLLGEADKNDRE
jgi:hypothetical protein